MATAKVTINDRVIMDITDTTATAETIRQGYTAYGADGAKIIGTYQGRSGVESVTQDANGYVVLDDDEGNQIVVDPLTVTSNDIYTAPTGHAYSPVTVNVSGGGGGGTELKELIDRSVTTLTMPVGLTAVGEYAFARCQQLTSIVLPNTVTSIGNNAFWECTNLLTVQANGRITSMGTGVFLGASGYKMYLQEARFPNMQIDSLLTGIGHSTTANACRELELLDLGYTKSLSFNSCLANTRKLTTLILRYDQVVPISSSTFSYSPMSGYNSMSGTVYVPSSLISSYQTASQWSTYFNNGYVTFLAIEGSPYEI